ncbi:conserved hypothetical protein [Desulfosarcina cetonica]|nr:conserved hypothetical protein [Desulfosarcina cetonica]
MVRQRIVGAFFIEVNMTRVKNYSITKESIDEMVSAGRFNPSLQIIFRDRHGTHRHKLSAGYMDDIHVYREAGLTCVLSINRSMDHIFLEAFEGNQPAGDIFLQGDQVAKMLGRSDLSPLFMIRRLMAFIG